MAEVFYLHVQEDRSIKYKLLEPIMQEDKDVATWRFRIPKVLNNIDMSAWSWWFVYVNAKGQEYSELLTLTDDIDEPSSYSTADYDIDYAISKFPGSFSFALEAINATQGGEIDGEWHTRTYSHKVDKTLQGNQAEYAETESDVISALMQEVRNKVNQLVGGATPLPVNLKSLMTDHDKVYLYTGEETGESTGYWYFWNGTDYVPGGLYGAGIQIDPTLSQSGQAADAKVVGDDLKKLYLSTRLIKASTGGQVFPYTITAGKTYIITNLTNNNTVGIRTCDSSGTQIESIKTGMAYNESVTFTADIDASYVRVYSSVANTAVKIETKGQIIDELESGIGANAEAIKDLHKNDLLYLGMSKYSLPSDFDYESPVSVYSDGYHFITDFNADDYKNTGAGVWYVSPTASGSGTSRKDPAQFVTAYDSANSGDTIILLEGKYYRGSGGYVMPKITKSINIIAEGDGALMIDGNYVTFTAVSGYTNVYSANRSLTRRVIDTSIEGKFFAYQSVNSIQDVADTEGSYYIDGNTVYVHAIDGGDPTGKVCCCIEYENTFDVDNSEQDVRLYVENVTLVGKYNGILINRKNVSRNLDVCFNNVSVILCGNTTQNAINVRGGDAVFNNCKVISAYKDGINYTGINTLSDTCECSGLEINCVAAGCGKEQADNTQNGSTAHSGSKVLRINGRYYDNKGASVADVHENTQSVNLGCIAYAPDCEGLYSQNFSTQQAGAEMWLDSCIASGGQYDVFCYTGSTMHVKLTGYNSASEYTGASLDVTHKRDVTEMMLLCGCILR